MGLHPHIRSWRPPPVWEILDPPLVAHLNIIICLRKFNAGSPSHVKQIFDGPHNSAGGNGLQRDWGQLMKSIVWIAQGSHLGGGEGPGQMK